MKRKCRKALRAYAVVVYLLLPLTLGAGVLQSAEVGGASAPEETGPLTETVSVNYVMIPFVAFGQHGRPVNDLRSSDVKLFIDDDRVEPDMFERANRAPVSFTILLDGSGSMALAGKLRGARQALETLIQNRLPRDDYALYVFAQGDVRNVVPFTTDGTRILSAVDQVKPWGKTALFDALMKMPDQTILGSNGSRAIILLTDGLDNASALSRQELARVFEGVDVPVYPLGLRTKESALVSNPKDNRESIINAAVLAGLAGMSGGRMAIASEKSELASEVRRILKELRAQYLIGFAPSGRGEVRYRRISLRFVRPVQSVRVRGGYKGTEPPASGRKAKR